MSLVKVSSVDCPHCGCNATRLIGAGNAGRVWARFECDFCGKQFQIGQSTEVLHETNGVVEVPVKCPKCKSTSVPVNNTSRIGQTVRRHRKCTNCGQNFYSTLKAES